MNEWQLKLKSILDRYSACTLTLDDAEREINESFAELAVEENKDSEERHFVYLEYPGNVPIGMADQIRKHMAEAYGGKFRVAILPNGLKFSSQPGFEPASINAKVGNVELQFDAADKSKFVCKVDGCDMQFVRRIEIVCDYQSAPTVKLEMLAKMKGKTDGDIRKTT